MIQKKNACKCPSHKAAPSTAMYMHNEQATSFYKITLVGLCGRWNFLYYGKYRYLKYPTTYYI